MVSELELQHYGPYEIEELLNVLILHGEKVRLIILEK
jgi:hypothetical protein